MLKGYERRAQILMLLGVLLFTLGLLSGFTIPLMKNIKMGLGAHMAGVTNGTFLVVAGLAWTRSVWGASAEKVAFGSVIYGTFANWFFITLAAIWGTKALAPISGQGFHGTRLEEVIVTLGLLSVAATIIIASCLLAWALMKKLQY